MLLLIVGLLLFNACINGNSTPNGTIFSKLSKLDPTDQYTIGLRNEAAFHLERVPPTEFIQKGSVTKATKKILNVVKHPTKTTSKPKPSKNKLKTASRISTCRCGDFPMIPNLGSIVIGTPKQNSKVVGGFDAPKGSLPFQVGLWRIRGSNPFCGGTLISPTFVLTAAHCMIVPAMAMKVALGDWNMRVPDGEIFSLVSTIIVHPKYNDSTHNFDFALIKLSRPAKISATVGLACLPKFPTQKFVGTSVVVSGWGDTTEGGNQSDILQAAYLTTVTNAKCRQSGYGPLISPNMICASTPEIDKDTCQGDSGGPMVTKLNNRVTVIGVTSFGQGCAHPPYLGVYARVTAVLNWILRNSDAGKCQA